MTPAGTGYARASGRGRTLVTVTSELERAEEARRILLEEGAFEAAPIDAPRQKAS